ncbi:TPA: hypothetical protein OCF47_003730 [Escherichia coli]|nr:hypothetical protein [Escherichia coli]HCP0055768.1 hypothetical protein [Escherichia coli]
MNKEDGFKCSFCGKPQHECAMLIRAKAEIFICSGCVSLCVEVMGKELNSRKTMLDVNIKQ